ncbi:LapA family protein [Thiotrichales bacterium 19S11-10]|nr:LapA family protein [Thiotrichales bacterium 19S11-10]
MKYIWWFFLLVVLIVIVILSILNSYQVTLDYFFNTITLPLAVLILLVFFIGSVLGILIGYFKGYKRSKRKYNK